MSKGRLEAFSDGVIAIIITIMVLELHAPEEASLESLLPLIPVFISYLLSFVFVGIYWNNHHHLLQTARQVNGRVLWANLHLLLWLSLTPFVTAWMGETGFAAWPVALYGLALWMSGFAYFLLVRALIGVHGEDSPLAQAVGADHKGLVSLVIYTLAVPLAFINPWIAFGLYIVVALIWFTPDQRFERLFTR
jgi:uncharacterized membrane protein